MAGKKTNTQRSIESYEHRDKQRLNNPPVGLVTPENDRDAGQKKKTYAYDPHLDPQLVWAGKAEHTSFEVPTVSLHVHERIDPRTIIEAVRKKNDQAGPVQLGLFEEERKEPLRQAIEFYQHKHGWTNRLIAGDSLLVMNSLLEKEGMAGKVQMIYFDPPYGIKYGSNFQPFVNKRDVKDGEDEDLTSEPEQIKAFRDTWELGIHSYLTYLRDRLLLCRELLSESGSIFVQINDENLHLVRCLLDEVFGRENFVSVISFVKTSGKGGALLDVVNDFLLWYAKDKAQVKYRQLFLEKELGEEGTKGYQHVQLSDGARRRLTRSELESPTRLPEGVRVFMADNMTSQEAGATTFSYPFEGRAFHCGKNSHWKTGYEGMERLRQAERLFAVGNALRYVRFLDEIPNRPLTNIWTDTVIAGAWAGEKLYAVQTNTKVVERCILMTTDPGDLVFDPTCGSGTTAYVAEQWGRRWITCDTSRVAITLARQRLMTAVFDYYELAHPQEGVGSGFKYKTVPHITLKSIANNPEIDDIYARLHPAVEEALAELNTALKGQPVKFKVTQGGRAGHFVDFAAPDTETFTMPAGQVVKVNELVEWEVPFEFPADWPEAARTPFERFHQARRALRAAIDEAIARHAPQETLYDQPFVDRKKVRVTGPFTVEAVPAPAVKSVDEILEPKPEPADASIARSGETLRQEEWRDELLKTGIRGKNGQYIRFARLEPLPGCRWLHAVGETRPSDEGANTVRESAPAYDPLRVVVSFGPEYGPLEQRQVEQAWEEARMLVPRPKLLIFAAFQFDPEAAKDIDEMKPELAGMQFLKVQMNADLLTDDLKKKRASNESFWLIGQPDVYLERIADGEDKGKYRVSVLGFDYYNTKTGQIESGGADRIALWMLDTDYDGRSLYPRQVFFPMAGEKEGWAKLARNLKAEIDEERIEAYRGTVSLPFALGEHRRIAVKIVDDRGIESLKVVKVDP
ncbi:site-specific DNA-methyltransferase [Synechococcus sp. W70.1]|uniref:site-specific DNA-methyltransferase n=1 Tax=Synechococcus sp. W70.1 TaxID=2964534 RepID=UPI0039C38A99